jgi:hypothetical protein
VLPSGGDPASNDGRPVVNVRVNAAALVGFRVDGRHGRLGTVVPAAEPIAADQMSELLVRGGASDALTYHVPLSVVAAVSAESRTVRLDLDVVDFTPRLGDDGSVDLYLVAE